MAEATNIPSFRPSTEWFEDWPFCVDTLVHVEALITGSAADGAVEKFLEPLTPSSAPDDVEGVRVHYSGGFTVESEPSSDGAGWRITLASAGGGRLRFCGERGR